MNPLFNRRYKLTIGNIFPFLLICYAIFNFIEPGDEPFGYVIGLISLLSALTLLIIDFYLQLRVQSFTLINVLDLIISILISYYLIP